MTTEFCFFSHVWLKQMNNYELYANRHDSDVSMIIFFNVDDIGNLEKIFIFFPPHSRDT